MGLVDPGVDDGDSLPRASIAFEPGIVGPGDAGRVVEQGVERLILGDAGDFRIGEQRVERSGIDRHRNEIMQAQGLDVAHFVSREACEEASLLGGYGLLLGVIGGSVRSWRASWRSIQSDDHANFAALTDRSSQVLAVELLARIAWSAAWLRVCGKGTIRHDRNDEREEGKDRSRQEIFQDSDQGRMLRSEATERMATP